MAGVGVVARCVHARLVVCPRLEPRARSWRRRCWASRGVGVELAVVVGGGWVVASSTAWPTRRGRVQARIVRWWEPVRGELASCGRLIGMGRADSLGRSCRVEPNIKKPIGHIPLAKQNETPRPFARPYRTCSLPSHLPLCHFFGFSVLLSTRICHSPSCYPRRNSSRLHIRICDARLPPDGGGKVGPGGVAGEGAEGGPGELLVGPDRPQPRGVFLRPR